jgi:hypothetical protein
MSVAAFVVRLCTAERPPRCGLASCCDQDGVSALLAACACGHLDVARWLVTHAGSDPRSERNVVSCRCSCCRPCVFLSCRERLHCVLASCCDQRGQTALLLACGNGRLDVARWLVTDVGSDARSERDSVSYRCSCRRLHWRVSLVYRERWCLVLGVGFCVVWSHGPSGGMCARSPRCRAVARDGGRQ